MSCTATSGQNQSGATDDGGCHSGDRLSVPDAVWLADTGTCSVPQAAWIDHDTDVAPAGDRVGMGMNASAHCAGTSSTL